MLAYASAGERLEPGDVISTGTMPGCCGLELDRWIRPGQTVELEIDGIGTLRNRISADADPLEPGRWAEIRLYRGKRPIRRLLGAVARRVGPAVDLDLYSTR